MKPEEVKPMPQEADTTVVEPPLKRAPTLYIIIFFKIVKGLLACGLAVGLYFNPAEKLPAEYKWLLASPPVATTLNYLSIHPENKFFADLAARIANVTESSKKQAAVGALLWSLFPLCEGIGMMFRAPWAGWLAIVESAFFVPLEVHKLIRTYSLFMVAVTVINCGIVWYLFANRERLFRHHHGHHHLFHRKGH